MLRALFITALLSCAPLLPAQQEAPAAPQANLSCGDEKLETALADLKKEALENGGSPRAARQVYLRYDYAGHREQALAWADLFVKMLKDMAARGNAQAMSNLGHLYLQGDPVVPADREQAVKWLKLAADKDVTWACTMLGRIYAAEKQPEEAHKAFAKAYALYEKRAAEGDEPSMLKQADMLFSGMGTKPDTERSLAIYKQLADKGNTQALAQLFRLYTTSRTKDGMRTGMEYARKLADKGDTKMAYLVYCELLRGVNMDKDEQAAAKYLQAAVAEPHPYPEALYQKGWDAEEAGNTAEAIPFYERAVLLNHDRAPVRLGVLLRDGAQGEEGRERGLQMLQDAATRLQSPFAAHELALHYDRQGDSAQADNWYIKASECGYAPAMARRGLLHLNPFSPVEWNPTLAYRWWKQGERADDPACKRYLNIYLYLFIPLLVVFVFATPMLLVKFFRKRAKR